ncbi:MAG: hypothetical protein ACOCUQ_01585 [Bacteroidota bacterium]
MKPWKVFSNVSKWFLRITLVLFVFFKYYPVFMQFSFDTFAFFTSTGFLASSLLLLVGGLISKPSLTAIAALILFMLSVLNTYNHFDGINTAFNNWLMISAVSFYFLTNGNK